MDRGAWWAAFEGRKGSDMTKQLTLSLSPGGQDTVKVGRASSSLWASVAPVCYHS